jgi:hypothetical protein
VESCTFIDDVIVLLFVKKVVLVLEMFQLLELVIYDEGHVAVAQTNLACKEDPAVVLAIESLALVKVEGSGEFGLDLLLLVDRLHIKAFNDDSL